MGGRVQITVYAPRTEEGKVKAGIRAAFDRFAALEQIMSDYRPASEVSLLAGRAGQGWVPVSRELAVVLDKARRTSLASDGAFDVTAGPVIRLWRQARQTGRIPAWTLLREARSLVDWRKVEVDLPGRRARIGMMGMKIDLGGIAKGYACDEALLVLGRHGLGRAMVEAGGDMAASGPPPGQRGWQIEAEAVPGGRIWLKNAALSTSGDAEQHALVRGRKYSHIVDPRTGFGLTSRVQATVLARRGLDTDPLATALCVLGPSDGGRLAESRRAKAWFVVKTD